MKAAVASRAVARLAPQKAGLARPSDSSRTDFCGQDVCGILARALHRILGWPRRSTLVVSDRLRGIAAGQRTRSRQELLSHPWHHRRGACYDRAGIWAGPIRRAVRGRGRRMDLFLQLCRPCGAQFRVLWLPARRLHGRNRRHPGRPRADRSLSFGGGALHGDRAWYHLCGACQSFDPGARALPKARRARARSDSPRRRLRNASCSTPMPTASVSLPSGPSSPRLISTSRPCSVRRISRAPTRVFSTSRCAG